MVINASARETTTQSSWGFRILIRSGKPLTNRGKNMNRVLKYATGQDVPEGAVYLWSCKNGTMDEDNNYSYVWHYFLVKD